jgi:hypothetical protein
VKNDLNALEREWKAVAILDIPEDNFDYSEPEVIYARRLPGQGAHLMVLRRQALHNMTPQQSRGASNQNLHNNLLRDCTRPTSAWIQGGCPVTICG